MIRLQVVENWALRAVACLLVQGLCKQLWYSCGVGHSVGEGSAVRSAGSLHVCALAWCYSRAEQWHPAARCQKIKHNTKLLQGVLCHAQCSVTVRQGAATQTCAAAVGGVCSVHAWAAGTSGHVRQAVLADVFVDRLAMAVTAALSCACWFCCQKMTGMCMNIMRLDMHVMLGVPI